MRRNAKHRKNKKINTRTILLALLIIIFILCIGYICYYIYNSKKDRDDNKEILNDIEIEETEIVDTKTERMLQLEELQKTNNEIIAWIEIEGTNVNYPVLQAKDNDFYLTHNYKKENSVAGSLFLDKEFDLINGSSNYLIYGHRNKEGLMFEDLMKYASEDFYKNHTKIKFTTLQKDAIYEILSVFYSRVYYKNEKNVFRYYYFVNAKNEEEYDSYIKNAKSVSLYDTGVNATYGEQLLTLSTCEYSQEDGRFVIVAKELKE